MTLASLPSHGRLRQLAFGAFQIVASAGASEAFAHASERGHVLLLPTHLYIAGGALAVAASFAVLWLGRRLVLMPLPRLDLVSLAAPQCRPVLTSLLSAAFLATLLVAAFTGAPDPIRNPLPGFIWSLWWIGLTLFTGLIGNLWPAINPWSGLASIVRRVIGTADSRPLLAMPERLGQWPAVALFLAFAWLELVDSKAEDPRHLAYAILAYSILTIGGMTAFGVETWMRRGECFAIFFRMIGALAPMQWRSAEGRLALNLGVPGHALNRLDLLPPGAVAFVLVALSTVSFDGLLRTFVWLGLNGVNPLEFPGRSAMVGINTIGLIGAALVFLAIYMLAAAAGTLLPPLRGKAKRLGLSGEAVKSLGAWDGGNDTDLCICGTPPTLPSPSSCRRRAFGATGEGDNHHHLGRLKKVAYEFGVSIIPIAFGYHLAHYLPAFPLEALNALKALSDPFATGANLLGLASLDPPQSLTAGHVAATFVYRLQTAIIVAAHVMAVIVAHGIATRLAGEARTALRLELPLTLLMIGYTVLGLWLLSTPVIG